MYINFSSIVLSLYITDSRYKCLDCIKGLCEVWKIGRWNKEEKKLIMKIGPNFLLLYKFENDIYSFVYGIMHKYVLHASCLLLWTDKIAL